MSGNVTYQTYEFSGGLYATQPSIETRGINIVYERLWTRALTSTVSVGPQWIGGYTLTPLQLQAYPPGTNPVVPSRLNVAVNAALSYTHRFTVGSVSYTRGANGGSGVQAGATADTILAQISSTFGPDWAGALSVGGVRTLGLAGGNPTQTIDLRCAVKPAYLATSFGLRQRFGSISIPRFLRWNKRLQRNFELCGDRHFVHTSFVPNESVLKESSCLDIAQ